MASAPAADLVLPRDCTFEPDDWAILARQWYPVALASEVGERPIGTKLLDQPLVIYRANGKTVVAPDICPHRGLPLSLGRQTSEGVECAYHGLLFGEHGRCTHIPAHPSREIPSRLHLAPFPCVERYGLVWTCLSRSSKQPHGEAIMDMPEWFQPDYQTGVGSWLDINAFAGRQVEGFLDVAHFAFVHADTFGDADDREVPPYRPKMTSYGFEAEYWSSLSNYPVGDIRRDVPGFRWLRHFRCHLPFTATIEIHFPGNDRLVVMNPASPVSARRTRLFAPVARNFDLDRPMEDLHAFNRKIFEEDKRIVEAQKPECLPLDPLVEAHIPADMSSLAYRRGLRSMGLSSFFTS